MHLCELMYVCMHACMCMWFMYVHVYICIHEFMSICMHVYMSICVHVYERVCKFMWVYVCVYMYSTGM